MKTMIFTAAVATVLLGAAAFAGQATGTIANISKSKDTITLSDGKTFHLPEGIEVESLSVGEQVHLAYAVGKHKVREVSDVRPVQ